MIFLLTFLEGVATFISPCILPLLPVYVAYFAGGVGAQIETEQSSASNASQLRQKVAGVLGFIVGFTIVFCALGAAAAMLGGFFVQNQRTLEVVCGIVMILFGLSYLGVIPMRIFSGRGMNARSASRGFAPSLLFGMAFAVAWTPCVGVFLGSALTLAVTTGDVFHGTLLLAAYSLGLGVPLAIAAFAIDRLESTLNWVKRHYLIVDRVCGGLLLLVGALLMSGLLSVWMALFTS